MDKRVQRREHPRDGIHGAGIPDIVKLVHRATARPPETQAPGMKDPPWLPDSSTGRLSRREDDTMRPTMQIISSQAKSSEAEVLTSKAYYQTKYFPHSEWDYEVGGFVPCDPLPQPMMLGKITVLIKSMGAWKIKHGVHPVGTLFTRWERLLPPGTYVQDSSGGPSVEAYMGYQASLADSGAQMSSVSSDVCEKLGLEPEDYLPTEMAINGASGNPLDAKGAILAKVQVGRMATNQVIYVVDNPIGSVLSLIHI